MPHIATLPNQAAARDVLTQDEAVERAARVSDAEYELSLDLRAGESTYRGDLTIRFEATGSGPLFLDYRGRSIERFEINGREIEVDWAGYRLALPPDELDGHVTVRIVYVNAYDTTGDGFHRFVDPEDGEEYVYTNFEPYEAHRLFPCFDQPDIKGRYTVAVTAPASWEVVANAPAIASEPV